MLFKLSDPPWTSLRELHFYRWVIYSFSTKFMSVSPLKFIVRRSIISLCNKTTQKVITFCFLYRPVLVSSTHLSAADTQTSRVIQPMRWGLIPPWHKAGRSAFKQMHNNCRGETISEKNTFSVPFNKGKRCVVIAEGYDEVIIIENKIDIRMLFLIYATWKQLCSLHRLLLREEIARLNIRATSLCSMAFLLLAGRFVGLLFHNLKYVWNNQPIKPVFFLLPLKALRIHRTAIMCHNLIHSYLRLLCRYYVLADSTNGKQTVRRKLLYCSQWNVSAWPTIEIPWYPIAAWKTSFYTYPIKHVTCIIYEYPGVWELLYYLIS